MSNYVGVKCPVCEKKFTQSDDIVVCPVCGAPHHRACYAAKNSCAFVEEHVSGKEWRAPVPDPVHSPENGASSGNGKYAEEDGGVVCSMCRSENPRGGIFCQKCGARLSFDSESFFNVPMSGFDPVSMVYGGLDPNEKIEDETVRDLAVYIGSNSAYYLAKFNRMAKASSIVSFNFPAMILGCFYFFYRKMYLIGGILLGLFIVSAVPGILQTREMIPQIMQQYLGIGSDASVDQQKILYYQNIINITGMVNSVVCIALSFLANHFYYLKAMGDVRRIRETQPEKHDEIAYCNELRENGGTSKTSIIVLTSAYFAVYFITFTYMIYNYLQAGGYPFT